MFIKYQTVRNSVVGTCTAILATIGAVFGIQSMNEEKPNPPRNTIAQRNQPAEQTARPNHKVDRSDRNKTEPGRFTTANEGIGFTSGQSARVEEPKRRQQLHAPSKPGDFARYQQGLQLANAKASPSGKTKDALGSSSPWKLNLYDDDRDGRYERAKLDKNRDEVDDEKWNFKDRRWERHGGEQIWIGKRWIAIRAFKKPNLASDSERYFDAMEIIDRGSGAKKSVKDILGAISPWKLNVYDDNQDGIWDRAKLDKNRDDIDDEKWNLKNGTWEKGSGQFVWANSKWQSRAANTASASPATRYKQAFALIGNGSSRQAQGKDILGAGSPWKLNVYDDDLDGNWDRAKLDTNRDNRDDEKWNFKNGRWEKDGGRTIWVGDRWELASRPTAAASNGNPETNRYRRVFKLLASGSRRSAKAKDLLGSGSPWKLNVYDDDRDGTWDRAKLDKNRDGKDDEKWNYKKGRWEKDGGASVWNGSDWESK